ncbi:MAG: hypothetical protein KDB22_25715 [Planctomycetales bacterium]|nr:hypothetical protein [Planctomycetales bacterium]
MNAAQKLATDLEQVLSGQVAVRDIIARQGEYSAVSKGVFANLEHYDADSDLRVKDSCYRTMQDGEMAKLVQLLRIGSADCVLERITFLQATELNGF